MKRQRQILTQHRQQRIALWLLTLLHWIASTLHPTARHKRQRGAIPLARISRWVAGLIILQALRSLRAPKHQRFLYWRATFNAQPKHFRRSLLGAKLRCHLHHRDPATHIAQLIALLRNLPTHATNLAHRLNGRLRRLFRAATRIAPNARLRSAGVLAGILR